MLKGVDRTTVFLVETYFVKRVLYQESIEKKKMMFRLFYLSVTFTVFIVFFKGRLRLRTPSLNIA